MALMCFHVARFDSRIDHQGTIVLFRDQDRSSWTSEMIALGDLYLHKAAQGKALSSYHIEAAIANEHCHAKSFETTDWPQIYKLYKKLLTIKPSPVVEQNMAIVQIQMGKTKESIALLLRLPKKHKKIINYYLYHATLGELYGLSNQANSALYHFKKAQTLTPSLKEQTLLQDKIMRLN